LEMSLQSTFRKWILLQLHLEFMMQF